MDAHEQIPSPPAQPPRYSLLQVAGAAQLGGTPGDALFFGWQFDPEVCGSARGGVIGLEEGGSYASAIDTGPANPAIRKGESFVVWAADQASTMARRDRFGRARRGLAASESYWIARTLATGSSLGLTQRTLNAAVLPGPQGNVSPGGSAVGPLRALMAVEKALGEALRGGRGMIHVALDVLDALVATNVLRFETTTWVTPVGNLIVADAGYTGAGPGDAVTPSAGTSWIHGTSILSVGVGPVETNPSDEPLQASDIDRSINDAVVRAHRLATWVWDGCAHVSAQVDLDVDA